MLENQNPFGWCRLIAYIISAFIAYFIANRFVGHEPGLVDALIALIVFLIIFLVLLWLSRMLCRMINGNDSARSENGLAADLAQTRAASAEAANEAAQASADGVDEVSHAAAEAVQASEEAVNDAAHAGEEIVEEAKSQAEGAKAAMSDEEHKAARSKAGLLDAARDGKADDLTLIKGVGEKLQGLCNQLGVYHFDQIAAWTESDVDYVDSQLEGFNGRITRDDWVGQAKILAAGGETEFSKRQS